MAVSSYYQGDTINMEFQLYRNRPANVYWDLTNCNISFLLESGQIKKTSGIGGSDNQIKILDNVKGLFMVIITKEESKVLTVKDYKFWIKIYTSLNEEFTVLTSSITILKGRVL